MAGAPKNMDFDLPYPQDDPLVNYPDGIRDPNTVPPIVPAPGTPPGQTADPWATAPADGNWQTWFLNNTRGVAPTPQQLIALEGQLGKHGIKVLRNAEGVAGKIQLPTGQIVDVIEAAGLGGRNWQWLTGEGEGQAAPASQPTARQVGQPVNFSMEDAGDWFSANLPAPEPFQQPNRPEGLQSPYTAPEFTAPAFSELEADPGYQARLAAAQQGLERSAAAKGSILSGGFIGKTMPRELQKLASDEYDNLYARRLGAFTTNAGLNYGARQMNESAYQDDVSNARNTYDMRYRGWRDLVGDQFRLGEMGLNATLAGAPR